MFSPLSPIAKTPLYKVLARYGLTRVTGISQSTAGFENKTFLVKLPKGRVILRESQKGKDIAHLNLEAALLDYLRDFPLTPTPLPNLAGELITVVHGGYYLLQNCLPGKTIANWNRLDNFTLPRLKDFFGTSAKFTRAAQGFKAKPLKNYPSVMECAALAEKNFDKRLKAIPPSPGKTKILAAEKKLRHFMRVTLNEMEKSGYADLPRQIVHFDIHPGNVNFAGNKVVGLFDFDWARFDCRLSDLAATISQSCYFYGPGLYRKDRIQAGLQSYRKTYGKSEFKIRDENYFLRLALQAYNIYQFGWAMDWYAKNWRKKASILPPQNFLHLLIANDYKALLE
ncbi:MAG: phosphotransferase [Dongiaceae bacterium]